MVVVLGVTLRLQRGLLGAQVERDGDDGQDADVPVDGWRKEEVRMKVVADTEPKRSRRGFHRSRKS